MYNQNKIKKFVEINSLHRNRNDFPYTTNFTAIFNQNASVFTTAKNALDPVFNSVPEYLFQTNMNSSGVGLTGSVFDSANRVEAVLNNDTQVSIGHYESNIDNFYSGYNILLFYFATGITGGTGGIGQLPNYIFDRTISSYSGVPQLVNLNRSLPRYTDIVPTGQPYSNTTLKYCIYDTSFNSIEGYDCGGATEFSFQNTVFNITGTPKYPNNIIIDYGPYMNGKTCAPPGIFDYCFFVYSKNGFLPTQEYASINTNVRKILSTEVDMANPSWLILYLDVPLDLVPLNGEECLITNNNDVLNVKPVLNIQFENIYGAFNYRKLYNNFYNDHYIENVQTRQFQQIQSYNNITNLIGIQSPFSNNDNVFNDDINVLGNTYLNYYNTYTIRLGLPENQDNLSFPDQVLPTVIGVYNIFALPSNYSVEPPVAVFNGINGVFNGTDWIYDVSLLKLSDTFNHTDNIVLSYLRITTVDQESGLIDPNFYDITVRINNFYKYATIYDNTDPYNPVIKARVVINVAVVDPLFKNVNNPYGDITGLTSIYDYTNPRVVPVFGTDNRPNPQTYEILLFSYDNFNPILYSGNFANQQNNCLYEIDLLALMVPNKPLKNAFNIGSYPYFYVVFHTHGLANKNLIYSNNQASGNAIFIVKSIGADTNVNYSFLNMSGMKQTINFKPNDNLYFSVLLPDGSLLQFAENDTFSPYPPRTDFQVSAVFSIEKIPC